MKKIALASMILLTVFVYSCKDDDSPNPKKAAGNSLEGTSWILTAALINPPIDIFGVIVSDFTDLMDPCEKDNIFKFLANNQYNIVEGASKCDPSDPDLYDQGTWSLSADGKTMIIDGDTTTVQTYNNTDLILSETWYDEDLMTNYTYTIKYKKQ